VECFPNECFADVCLSGFAFRLRVAVDKEVALVPWPHASPAAAEAWDPKAGARGGGGGGGKGKCKAFPVLSVDPLTASGYGDVSPADLQAAAAAVRAAAASATGGGGGGGGGGRLGAAAAAVWGPLAPVPERWRLHVSTATLPIHHSLVQGVATAHRAFSPALRLALRWAHAPSTPPPCAHTATAPTRAMSRLSSRRPAVSARLDFALAARLFGRFLRLVPP
jgi:hypothetical protein